LLNFEEIDKARKLLGLPQQATLNEIKDAYRRIAKEYHPDKQKPGKKNDPDRDIRRFSKDS